jgi:hypothetical protein
MRHITKYPITVLAVLIGGFLMAQVALAEPVAAPLAVLEDGSEAPGMGHALSSGDLEGVNGRQGVVDIDIEEVSGIFSSTDQKGFLDHNSIEANQSSFTTGANTIEAGAFSYMNGVATVIQNSGNQVLIQNATVVDVIVR